MSQLTRGLKKGEETEKFLQGVRGSHALFEQLVKVLEEDKQSSIKIMRKPEVTANHALLAAEVATQETLDKIITMVNQAMKEK